MPSPIYGFWLKLNGVDSVNVKLYPVALQGQWDAPALSYDETNIPGKDGADVTTDEPQVEPMEMVADCELRGTDASDFEANLDKLKYLLRGTASSTTMQVSGGNQPDRYRSGKYVGPLTVQLANVDAGNLARVQFKIRFPNPIQFATSATTDTGITSGTDHACALGTYRSKPVITITSGTNPVLTYKNSSGSTIATMTLTGTGDWVIDCEAETITLNGSPADDATTDNFIRLDPLDGDYLTSAWPTLRTSSGTMAITYTAQWL